MLPAAAVPAFDGKGSSFSNYDQQVRLWLRVANLEPPKRAPALIPRMDTAVRKVYVAAGSGIILSGDGADRLTNILRENFAPGAADSVYREVV